MDVFDLGWRPTKVTHFLHPHNETIGLDVLEGSTAVNQVSPLLFALPRPVPLAASLLC